jgi:hypothetical protein
MLLHLGGAADWCGNTALFDAIFLFLKPLNLPRQGQDIRRKS